MGRGGGRRSRGGSIARASTSDGAGGLVAGGGVFAAAKLGFFGKFWKVIVGAWKLVLIAAVGIGAGVKKFFGRLVGGEKKPNESHRSG